jgi:hypothetical protein
MEWSSKWLIINHIMVAPHPQKSINPSDGMARKIDPMPRFAQIEFKCGLVNNKDRGCGISPK